MKGFVLGIVVALVCIALGVYIYFSQGLAPVATASQAMPFEKKLANMALHARVKKEMPKTSPMQPTEADYVAGAHTYVDQCSVCHGLPNQQQSAIGKGEFPKPPHLFHGKGVTDDEAGETYWKVENGIRLTGMPAYKGSLSETQIWQVSWLLANANKLPASAIEVLTTTPPQPAAEPSAKK